MTQHVLAVISQSEINSSILVIYICIFIILAAMRFVESIGNRSGGK